MELISYKIYIKRVIMVPFGIQIFMLKFIRNYIKFIMNSWMNILRNGALVPTAL